MRLRCPACHVEFLVDSPRAGHLPFCSDRCQTIDLGRWLRESYAFPATRVDDEEEGEGAYPDSVRESRGEMDDDV